MKLSSILMCDSQHRFESLNTVSRLAIAALATAPLLFAAPTPAQAQGEIEEVVVTAEFREANVQDTPIAITAVTAEMLESRNQYNIYEVAAQAPNVTLQPAGQSFAGMYAFIRGIGQYDFIYAVEPGVGIYVDDVYYSTLNNSLLELLDVQRVEILRGPQGTLAGRNSIGGAVKLYSKKPGEEHGGQVQLSYGSYNKISGNASGDFTIFKDTLFARFAMAAKSRDGYVDLLDYGCVYPGSGVPSMRNNNGCKTGELGNQQYVSGRASFRWLATDDIEVNLIADVLNDDSGAGPAVLLYNHKPTATPLCAPDDGNPATPLVCYLNHVFVPYGPNAPANAINDPYVNYANFLDTTAATPTTPWKPVQMEPIAALDQWGISGQIDWQINEDLSLTSITAYRTYQNIFNADADGSPVAVTMVGSNLDHWSVTEEVRLNGTFNDIVDWTLGGYYLDQEGTYEARVDLNYANLDFIHGPDITPSSSLAFFGHATWHINDQWNIFAGLRYSEEEKDYTHRRRNPNLSTIGSTPGVPNFNVSALNLAKDSFADDRIDYRVGTDYAWTDDFMTYFQVSTGYKGGGVNPRPFFLVQMLPFGPEELTTFEVGFKSTLLDNRMRLNAAGFFNDYTDIQLNLSACERPAGPPFNGVPGAPCAAPRNVGDADVWGAEVEMEYYPTEAIAIDASISWLDFEYTRVDTGALTGSSIAPLNMVAPYTPEIKWSIGAQYTFAPTAYGTFAARINANYQDQIYSSPTNDTFNLIDDYTLINARLTWNSPDEDWQAALEFNNITDELYYINLFDQHQTTSVGQVIANPGLPFTWGISIKRYF